MATISVVIPCYGYGHYLRQCVESVVRQAGVEMRILIIDDNSPDDTFSIASSLGNQYSNVRTIRHDVNLGHIRTYNEGLDWADADYTLLLSADDLLMPGALFRSASVMDAHPEVGFTFGRAYSWDDEQIDKNQARAERSSHETSIMDGHDFIKLAGACNIVPTPTAVVRTKLQKRLGGYKEQLPHSGDMEMWLRFAAHGAVGFLHEYQAIYRQHKLNMSRSYQVRGWLPDLFQREAALRLFFQENPALLRISDLTLRKSLCWLGKEAYGYAGTALSLGEKDICIALEAYARSLSPFSRFSKNWIKLNLKKRLRQFPISTAGSKEKPY